MSTANKPLLIKRYASRRLYNTETSDYVTLEDIAGFVRNGRDVQIVDLKSGDDLTRQYLLQIIAEHESRGESVLPINVLNDLVRSYTTQASSIVPQVLAMSFDMMRDGQAKIFENMGGGNALSQVPGFDALRAQQEAFVKAMTLGFAAWPDAAKDNSAAASPAPQAAPTTSSAADEDLQQIKSQLADLQEKLSKLGS